MKVKKYLAIGILAIILLLLLCGCDQPEPAENFDHVNAILRDLTEEKVASVWLHGEDLATSYSMAREEISSLVSLLSQVRLEKIVSDPPSLNDGKCQSFGVTLQDGTEFFIAANTEDANGERKNYYIINGKWYEPGTDEKSVQIDTAISQFCAGCPYNNILQNLTSESIASVLFCSNYGTAPMTREDIDQLVPMLNQIRLEKIIYDSFMLMGGANSVRIQLQAGPEFSLLSYREGGEGGDQWIHYYNINGQWYESRREKESYEISLSFKIFLDTRFYDYFPHRKYTNIFMGEKNYYITLYGEDTQTALQLTKEQSQNLRALLRKAYLYEQLEEPPEFTGRDIPQFRFYCDDLPDGADILVVVTDTTCYYQIDGKWFRSASNEYYSISVYNNALAIIAELETLSQTLFPA